MVSIAARSKAEARLREARLEDRREHLGDGLLDNSIVKARNPQQALAATGFGYFYPTHRLRLISPVLELFFDGWPVRPSIGGELRNGHAVTTRPPLSAFTRAHAQRRLSLAQISPGKMRELSVHKRPIYLKRRTGTGFAA
jgi:hypothetical protein